ncbi:putative disease resistance protein RGA3 [Coffea arabica]|uniref:Disease resistance protein RGA3 n=1 Tax=Coffea arabica TaxID=13443 RepID=A0A6P6WWI6_COFAR|nr:putative disease resistance protein RGA3 [Coffea arabica]XP_027119741.1 putative disease resistance protein RGA3 [Coffea arabica]XP_027119742.1 putative disease resistance protein RGA3 [Coffea arabica]XP_027119743.1 putative disease resistance protein RGA3 [Coffea arabica]XP_027119744.1 putative disease resistance protein RGA3 [Coffea arabica]XP_027119745.1 putative disease resistance protein RGA3 [Coffea arabica]XP_027119746.1 putative disease resistance protein RGA3 [Coffea arabica]XP_0
MADKVVDALLGSTVKVLVEKAINLASEQIGLFVGLKKDLEKLTDTLTLIQAVLRDAEEQLVTQEFVKRWLENLEAAAFDAGNLLDDINYEMIRRKVKIQNQMKRKVCFFFSLPNPIAFRSKMACKIQKINMDLKRINEEARNFSLQSQTASALSPPSEARFIKNRETDSVTVDASFVGRDNDVSAIVTQLTAMNNNETISVLAIVGMGGIGKTTLARKVFNDPNIEKHFDKRIWVCVSEDFNSNRLFGMILQSLQGREPEAKDREARVKQLKALLGGKKYLLVLDDVWNKESTLWNDFLGSLKGTSQEMGSWILVTTREQQVATITRISSPQDCSLKQLSDDQCWLILKENAFVGGEVPVGLQDIGLKIAQRCRGLPLAASVLGGMLHNKGPDEWQSLESGLQSLGGDENSYVTKILKLSFDHLPHPSLKKCFAYCSIFPQDFEMERNQLIQLWAAEGFLNPNPREKMCMEEVGKMYFNILLDSNLFQDAEKDAYGNVLYCKIHDLVHDMVQSISNSKTLRLTESSSVDKETSSIRYLALERSQEEMTFPSTESFKCITTLFLRGNISLNDREMSFFMLRVLNLRALSVKELPKSIGKLTHLRYLDSSKTSIKTLPESLCQLYSLQTLRVKYCDSLTKFPENFKNLVNLRHFDFFSKDKSTDIMPLEIGQLQFLQTLPFFNIGEERGRQIGELRNLKNLSGQLEVRNLELVRSKEEAESANLIGKPNIDVLKLLWNEIDNSRNNDSEYNQVLEGLHPHPNLKGLIIERFFGDQLSTWIGELGRLVKFELQNCKNCKELPTLGNMPLLRFLHLEGLDSLTSLGPSFYGRSGLHSGGTCQRPLNLFPTLECLIVEDMLNLREWTEASVDDGMVVVFPVLGMMRIINCPQLATLPNYFPRLKELEIHNTQNGSALMTYICSGVSTLTRLSIESVNRFTKLSNVLFQNNPKLEHLELNECDDLTHFLDFSFDVPQTSKRPSYQSVLEHTCIDKNDPRHLVGLESLETLIVHHCPSLESISIPRGRKYFTALRELNIQWCHGLTHLSIPQISESGWDSTSSPLSSSSTCPPPLRLERLVVYGCTNLISFPIDLARTPSLSYVDISECEELTDLPKGKLCSLTSLRRLEIGPFSETTTELHCFLDLFDALPPPHPYFPSLSTLFLFGWPHWESLPEQLQHLSALTALALSGFGVKSLPDWFGKLSSLEKLSLWACEKLENLPSHQSMRSLTRLRELQIFYCPLVKERCNPESSSSSSSDPNSERSKISHIPYILIH